MVPIAGEDPFLKFAAENRSQFAFIAKRTAGEYSTEDVRHEAWILAQELRDKGLLVELDNACDCALLLKYLYQRLVRYTDTRVRFAQRFEAPSDADAAGERNSLLNVLSADSESEPLEILLARESPSARPPDPPSHESPASALIVLLRMYDNKMAKLADYLLISVSYCYRCYAKARRLAVSQRPLRAPVLANEEELMPRPWRRFRIAGHRRDPTELHEVQYELI